MNSTRFASNLIYTNGSAVFELLVSLRRDTGNQFKLLGVLSMCLLLPAALMMLALVTQNAATNLEKSLHVSAFVSQDLASRNVDALGLALSHNPDIESVTVLPATDTTSAILEIRPTPKMTVVDIKELVTQLEVSTDIGFVAVNPVLLERNINAYGKSSRLASILVLLALISAVAICMVIVRLEIFRSNSAYINLQRQLGATLLTITRPFVYRAAFLTLIAILAATTLVTIFNRILGHFVATTSFESVFLHSLPASHLILLAIVSVAAGSFAAATALQNTYSYVKHIVTGFLPGLSRRDRDSFAQH